MALQQEYYFSGNSAGTSTQYGFGFPARTITVVNDGATSVHVDGKAGTATTADPEVKAGETYDIPLSGPFDGRTAISIISASGTPAIRIYAYE